MNTLQAYELGKSEGLTLQAPAQSAKLTAALNGRKVGQTPAGETPTIELLKAWNQGATNARRMAAAKERFNKQMTELESIVQTKAGQLGISEIEVISTIQGRVAQTMTGAKMEFCLQVLAEMKRQRIEA